MLLRIISKLAARLEICALRGGIRKDEAAELNRLLVRIDQMTAKLADVWAEAGR